jgi:hypothetical protein
VPETVAEFNETSIGRIDNVIENNAKGNTRFRRMAADREKECFIMGWTVCGIQLSSFVLERLNQIKRKLR